MIPLLLVFATALTSCAAILEVPGEYGTIVEAMGQSREGDTVLVAPGLYCERIVFPAGVRTLAGQYLVTGDSALIAATILQPDPASHPDTMTIVEMRSIGITATLSGFTLQYGLGINVHAGSDSNGHAGGAVYATRADVSVDGCVFEYNDAYYGSAIRCDSGGVLDIKGSCFRHNNSLMGTILTDSAEVHISRSRFHHNTVSWAGVVFIEDSESAVMDSCVVDSNQNPTAVFGTVFIWQSGSATVRYCDFLSNSIRVLVSMGAALSISQGQAVIEHCRFVENEADGGSGLTIGDRHTDSIVRDCWFEDNRGNPAAAQCGEGRCTFERCTFVGNQGHHWSTLVSLGTLFLEDCQFLNNASTEFDSGAAILSARDTLCAVNCIFSGNELAALSDRYITPRVLNVENNYWGDPTGPYHATRNPGGQGDVIFGDQPDFIPWLTEPPQSADDQPSPLPEEHEFLSAYPNPFNSTVRLEFNPRPSARRLRVYNLLGQAVDEVAVAPFVERVIWKPQTLPTGIYFAQIGVVSAKLLYLR